MKLSASHSEALHLYENDVPLEVAQAFIRKHRLNPKVQPLLLQQIFAELQQLLESELQQMEAAAFEHTLMRVEASPGLNSGEKLYQKGLIQQKKARLQAQRLKDKQMEEESKRLTFHPQINRVSNLLASRIMSQSEEDLQKRSKRHEKQLNHERLHQDYAKCTFTPNINDTSRLLAAKKTGSTDKFSELYEEASVRRVRKEQLEEQFYKHEYSFRPELRSSEASLEQSSVFERLLQPRKPKDESSVQERSNQVPTHDPETGQPLFKPMTGRPPKFARNTENLPVGEYLYSQKKAVPDQSPTRSTEALTNPNSDKILLNIKIQNYYDIFQTLRPDSEGLLHGNALVKELLPADTLRVVEPLLDEVQAYENPLTFEDFVDAMENLFVTLPHTDKSMFYTRKKPKEDTSSRAKPAGTFDGQTMYERQLRMVKETEERLKQEKEKSFIKELSECTFHPTITQYTRQFSP